MSNNTNEKQHREMVKSFRDVPETFEAVENHLSGIKLTNKEDITLARFYRACNVLLLNGTIENKDIVAAIFMEGAK